MAMLCGGSWAGAARLLAPFHVASGTAWWYVSRGEKVTAAKFNALRAWRGLPQLPERKLALPCPSCGEVHGEGLDCHHLPVVGVALLQPGARVLPPRSAKRKRDERKTVHLDNATHAALRQHCQARGITPQEFILSSLRQAEEAAGGTNYIAVAATTDHKEA
jgi:hypothetical protein